VKVLARALHYHPDVGLVSDEYQPDLHKLKYIEKSGKLQSVF
jgi:hypothetical protein